MDLRKVISDAVDSVSYQTTNGMVNLSDPYHIYLIQKELKDSIDPVIVDSVLYEADTDKEPPLEDKEKEKAKEMGLVWKGKGYGKENEDGITHKNDGGKLVAIEKEKDKEKPKGLEPDDFTKKTGEQDPEQKGPQPGEEHHGAKMPTPEQTKKDTDNKIEKAKEKVAKMPDGPEKENAKLVLDMLSRFANAKTKEEKIAVLQEMQASGLIQRNDRGSGTKKIYFSGDTGLHYKEFGQNTALHREIAILDEEQFEETGQGLLNTKDQANYGKKKMAPMNLFDGQEKEAPVKQNDDGSVQIGDDPGTTLKTLPDPNEDGNADKKLRERITEAYTKDGVFNKEEYEKAKVAIKRHNLLVKEIEKVIAAGGGSLKCTDPIPGVQPDTPENRDKIKNKTGENVANRLEELSGGNLTGAQKKILDRLRKLQSPPLSNEEYENELMSLATAIQNDIDFSTGYADLAETLSYMRHLNRGSVAYLPSAGNFPLGDVLTFPDTENQPDFENDSPEDIAAKMKAIFISVDNRSIKKGEGGASSTHTKVELTEFVDMDGIPAKEVAKDQAWLSDKGYDQIFGVRGEKEPTEEEVDTAHDEVRKQAEKYGVDVTSDEHIEQRRKRVDSSIDKVKRDRKKANKPDLTPEEEALMRKKHEAYYDLGKVQADVYNRQLDQGAVQLYTNEVWKEDKDGNATTSETDGMDCKAYIKFEFAAGWLKSGKPNNKVPSRFKNKQRDAQGNLVDC